MSQVRNALVSALSEVQGAVKWKWWINRKTRIQTYTQLLQQEDKGSEQWASHKERWAHI